MADLEDLLVKTSRTFALSIPMLPEPTRAEVTIAYLLFRIADTFEDASHWSQEARVRALEEFIAMLEGGETSAGAAEVASRWVAQDPSRHAGYVELISELPAVLAEFSALSPAAREHIGEHTVRTARGMEGFVARTTLDGLHLRDIADLQHYCYVVAGIVGEMMTELFLLDRRPLAPLAGFLRQRAPRFGEALQLVNVLKDSADDAVEGRCYLPQAIDRGEVFELARADLEASTEYVHALQDGGAPRGIVEFTALPVLLARATLDRVEAAGPGAKLTRPEVATIVQEMNLALDQERQAISL